MAAAIKMSYGDVMIKDLEDDTPLYITEKDLHNWYLAHQRREGSMMYKSAHKGVMALVEDKN